MPASRPMSDFIALAHDLDDDAFRRFFGTGHLIITDGRRFQMKERFQPTSPIDLEALTTVSAGIPLLESPVFSLKRNPESAYSFISVGRTNNCDVALPDESVSKLHAIIKETDGCFSVQDADSHNGTRIDNQPVPKREEGDPIALVSGVDISFGLVRMQFVDASELRRRARELPKTMATS